MRILIAGIDGYLGWPLAQFLAARGHHVGGIDRFLRREWVSEVCGISALPNLGWEERAAAFKARYDKSLPFYAGDLLYYPFLRDTVRAFQPDAVVHLAEMPSAPYSMIDVAHASFTQQNNVIGSLNLLWALHEVAPTTHLVKLGTMGEYGTPNLDIPEGFFEVEFRGRNDRLPFPRQAGSFYHWSKVHDSNNAMYACKIWGLAATDVMQGVVYGTRADEVAHDALEPGMATRFDFDPCFGTVINRFVCQAVIGHPLTVYGTGGQRRGFLPLRDSIECLTLTIENPASAGEYRVFNQFEQTYSVGQLAEIVSEEALDLGLAVSIQRYDNPRVELQEHYYQPDRQHLLDLGYWPRGEIRSEVRQMFMDVMPYKSVIETRANLLIPDIRWDTQHRRSKQITELGTGS
jgi:UDP-sulfoquinovose synthase